MENRILIFIKLISTAAAADWVNTLSAVAAEVNPILSFGGHVIAISMAVYGGVKVLKSKKK